MLRSFSFICVLLIWGAGEQQSQGQLVAYGYGIMALLVGVIVKMAKAMAMTLGRIRAKAR